MGNRSESIVTTSLWTARDGGSAVPDEPFSVMYGALRERLHARSRRASDQRAHEAAALIHEVYRELGSLLEPRVEQRTGLLVVAARAMRQLVLDDAHRQRDAGPGHEGGAASTATMHLASGGSVPGNRLDVLLDLDASLTRLQADNPLHGRIVECLFFGGLTIDETASALGIEPAAVRRGWTIAQAWLYRDLQGPRAPAES